jgi:hypothetical protein
MSRRLSIDKIDEADPRWSTMLSDVKTETESTRQKLAHLEQAAAIIESKIEKARTIPRFPASVVNAD